MTRARLPEEVGPDDPRELITAAEAAKRLGVPKKFFTERVRNGEILPAENTPGKGMLFDAAGTIIVKRGYQDRKALKLPAGHCVYVAGFAQYVKIGWTGDLAKRFRQMLVFCPEEPVVYAALKDASEDELHRRFAPYRMRGEWFLKAGDLRDWIEAGCPL